jgi:phosphoribosylglycinamide formyltransferase-1
MKNVAVFASHGGSDFQAFADGCASEKINARVCVLISNNSNSKVMERAKNMGIPAVHLSEKTTPHLGAETLRVLREYGAEIIFLAGYMKKVPDEVLHEFEGNVYNIHPALLPKFGGRGMYGINVHTAVLAANESETGITIHRVTANYDEGEILAQKKVPVLPNDTPETLAARVLEQEHIFIVEFFAGLIN